MNENILNLILFWKLVFNLQPVYIYTYTYVDAFVRFRYRKKNVYF